MKSTTQATCTVIFSAAILLGACSDDDSQADQRSDPTTTAAEREGAAEQEGTDQGGGVEEREARSLVEQTVALPDEPDDEISIGIQSLTVEGETMVLRLAVTPNFASAGDDETVKLGDAMDVGIEFFGVRLRLLDRVNLKEYSVIHEQNKWWASAAGEVEAQNGEPMYAFAVFAAPEDDIDTIDVRLNEQWPEFTDVPITR